MTTEEYNNLPIDKRMKLMKLWNRYYKEVRFDEWIVDIERV